uniref:Protein kinase domain-containing protein n=1 Tax=viral metagenome TaxID=1070528 RepID=A0A6C0L7B2_9ZZZZ
MSIKNAEVVGEGTYGCVHKPSLKCKNSPSISYINKVSKLLKKKDAETEMHEYDKLVEADKKKEYYLGKPDDCNVDEKNAENLMAIKNCKIGADAFKKLSGFKLLVMNDGGINLEKYTKKMSEWPISEMSSELCEKFLLESLRLFHGLKVFEDYDLVHHDLKPQNIVYNETLNRTNFIDFGLMTSRKKITNEARKSTYDFALFHWSFPWEYEFINKKEFNNVVVFPENQDEIIEEIHEEIREKKGTYYENIKTFFYYAIDKYSGVTKYQKDCQEYVDSYGRTVKKNMLEMKYEKFLEASVRTIDVFGLGLSLNYWLHVAKKFLPSTLTSELGVLYNKMISAELAFRPFISDALIEMEKILTKNGLLQKYNKKIINHMVVDSNEVEIKTPSIEHNVFDKIAKPNEALVRTDPGECPEGMVKNDKGKCVNIKRTEIVCPEDKERNPKTKRCVLKCKPGYIRNEDFRCIKVKVHRQVVDKASLPCPEGKERNPKTRRCVTKCKPGYVRNSEFKCVKNRTVKLQQ